MKFRKRPIIIEACKYTGDGLEILEWSGTASPGISAGTYPYIVLGEGLFIHTLEGKMEVSEGDWVICGVNGEFYPCKSDIFEKTYERVEE